jgi:hypothetical protein
VQAMAVVMMMMCVCDDDDVMMMMCVLDRQCMHWLFKGTNGTHLK